MSCGELVLKSASTTFTGYFLIVGVAFLFYGITSAYYILKVNSLDVIERELVAVPSLCLVLFSIFLLLLVIIGCCGICKEIPWCSETYSVLLLVIAVMQFGLGVCCMLKFQVDNPKFAQRIHDSVTDMYLNYKNDPTQLDDTQELLGCCGVDSFYNWYRDNKTIPSTCCASKETGCRISSPTSFVEGCSVMVFSYDVCTNYIIGWSLIIVGITEVIAAALAITLSCAFWRNRGHIVV